MDWKFSNHIGWTALFLFSWFTLFGMFQERAGQIVPHFSHSTKYLFVTKDSKMVTNLPPVVEGEPVITLKPQKLKLLSPQRLVLPKSSIFIPGIHQGSKLLVKKLSSSPPTLTALSKSSDVECSSQTGSCPPKLTPMPKFIVPKGSLKFLIPNESVLPKLTPISKSLQIPFPKGSSPPKLTPISKSLKVIFPKGSSPPKLTPISNSLRLSPPKLKLMSSSGLSSPLKLQIVSQPLSQNDAVNISPSIGSQSNHICSPVNSNSSLLIASKKRFELKTKLERAPKYLHSPLISNVHNISDEFISLSNLMGVSHPLPRNHNVCFDNNKNQDSSPVLYDSEAKRFNSVRNKNEGQNSVDDAINDSVKLEKIFLEHQYTKKQPCERSNLNVTQTKSNSVGGSRKKLGSNNVKAGLNLRNQTESKSSSYGNVGSKSKIQVTSSLLSRLKAGSLSKASSVVVLNPFCKSDSSKSLHSNGKMLPQHQNLDLFECPICKMPFLSYGYLQKHIANHENSEVSDEEKLHKVNNSKVIKRPKYSHRTRKSDPTMKTGRTNKWKDTIYKDPSNFERFENDIVIIPNINGLKKSKDDEFIRLTNLVSTVHGNEDGIKCNKNVFKYSNSKVKRSSVGKVEEDNYGSDSDRCSTLSESQDLKPKGSVIDESGVRHSLRKKTKSFKSNSSEIQISKRPITGTASCTSKKNPVVVLSKIDCNNISNSKRMKHSINAKSSHELSDDDDCSEGWRGWDDCSEESGCVGNNDNLAEISDEVGVVKTATQSKSKKENKSKSSTKICTKVKRTSQILKKDLKKSSSASQTEPSSMNSKLKCPTCELLIQKSSFKSHILLHVKSEYSCKLCNKKFEKSSLLRRHVLQDHKVVKQFRCLRRDCSRRFESKRDMEKHMRSHRK